MGQKDVVSKEILKRIARDIAIYILKIEIREDMELIDKEFTRVEKRDADLIFKNGQDIVHIEIQNQNHPQMHLRMMRYLNDMLFEYEGLTIKGTSNNRSYPQHLQLLSRQGIASQA